MSDRAVEPSEYALIDPLWHGAKTVQLRMKELQRLLLYYGPTEILFREGRGYVLAHKRSGPGVYSVWLEEKVYA